MTNKEFQNILAQYPDDYQICIDNVFGWEKTHNMIDPQLYVNTDIGQIEIEPNEYRELDDKTIHTIYTLGLEYHVKLMHSTTDEVNPSEYLGKFSDYVRERLNNN